MEASLSDSLSEQLPTIPITRPRIKKDEATDEEDKAHDQKEVPATISKIDSSPSGSNKEEPISESKVMKKPSVEQPSASESQLFTTRVDKPKDDDNETSHGLKKKAPPPVPKKPSSRIAAFHEMLKKQQQKDISNTEHENLKSSVGTNGSNMNPDRVNFAKNLNGLFALPGMTPSGDIPLELNKGLSSPLTIEKKDDQTEKGKRSLPLATTKRVRGPRGRKLPTKIANTEKIVNDTTSCQFETFHVWEIAFDLKKEEITEENEQKDISVSEKAIQATVLNQPAESTSINHSIEGLPTNKEFTVGNPSPDVQSGDTQVHIENGDVVSLEDAIDSRDQNESVEVLEQELEDQAERRMEEEMLEEDKRKDFLDMMTP